MEPREYRFGERLAMSCGHSTSVDVSRVLLDLIPGALQAHQAGKANDKAGVDWWVEMSSARHLAVDAKVRESDWRAKHPDKDDLALETWSVVESGKIGWTRDESKRCDFILWLWKDTGRHCLISFPMLCKAFQTHWQEWAIRYGTSRQRTPSVAGGYHSECVFVPRREIWKSIYDIFGGNQT